MSSWGVEQVGHRPVFRRCVALVVAVATIMSGSVAEASAGSTPAERAAAEIQAARDRADAAAQSLFDTEAEIDRLSIEVAETEEELAELEADANAMRSGLEQRAVRQFVGAGGAVMPLLIDIDDANDVLTASVLSSVATENVFADIDEFDSLMLDVGEKQEELAEQQAAAASAVERFAELIVTAEAEVVTLGEIEAQRLEDEAVQQALAAEQRRRAEQERQQQEAAAARAAAAAATSATPSSGNSSGGASSGTGSVSTSSGQSNAVAPVEATPAPQSSGSGLACPVAGPRAFADTWGAPRSGGRKHQGVDVISPSGTPLVAMESGRIEFRSNKLGGLTLRLYGNSGTRYYYAHLSRYEGSNRSVSKGDVVGYIGRTGNTTTNHLHLQIHPGGGQPINPYPQTRAACG
ncbi:MAG: M23 family metallopeptidase [Ilumatobacter sp.]